MIPTLYLRIAIVICVVVWSSLALTSYTFTHSFRNQLSNRVEELLQNAAELVVRLIQEGETQQLGQTVAIAGKLNRGQELHLYAATGERYASRPGASARCVIPESVVQHVLDGGIYSSFREGNDVEQCPQGSVGTSFEYGGIRYALFVATSTSNPKRSDWLDMRNLLPILLITTLLIALAAIYLVRPLKQITEATRRIAGGDFNVRLRIRQKDELGELATSITHMAQELQKMEKMRQEFVSNVSHDIQTPLTSIRGFSKLLQQESLDASDRQSYLQLIESESARLSRLSENLLKLASLESEQHPLDPKPLVLDEQLRRCVVACEPLWSNKQLEIELDLPHARIVADEDSLGQVWMNLLHNAIKFTPVGGRIVINLALADRHVTVTVKDTGSGISAEDLPHLFRRFYKVDPSRRHTEGGGSGLGLAIVKKIVDLHGGSIVVDSAPGSGTEVRVRLPLKLAGNTF